MLAYDFFLHNTRIVAIYHTKFNFPLISVKLKFGGDVYTTYISLTNTLGVDKIKLLFEPV